MSDSLWPHRLQHARLPCPSPSPKVCSNSCLLSQWCHPSIASFVIPFTPLSFPASESFQWVSTSHKVAKVLDLSFSISSFNEYLGLISFTIDWFHLAVQGTQAYSPTPQFKSINSSVLRLFYGPSLTSVHDDCNNHRSDHMDFCWQMMSLLFNMLS